MDSSSEEMGVRGLLVALTELEAGESDPPVGLSLLCMMALLQSRFY